MMILGSTESLTKRIKSRFFTAYDYSFFAGGALTGINDRPRSGLDARHPPQKLALGAMSGAPKRRASDAGFSLTRVST